MVKKKLVQKKKTAGKARPAAKKPTAKAKPKVAAKKAKKPAKPVASASAKASATKGKKVAPKAKSKKAPAPKPAAVKKPIGKKPAPAVSKPKATTIAKPAAKTVAPAKPVKVAVPVKVPIIKAAAKSEPKPKKESKKDVAPKGPIIAVMTGLDPLGGPAKQLTRAKKERFTQEFYLRATPGSLYDLLSTPSGFSEWFCDDVDVHGDVFTFRWGNDAQEATCLGRKYGELIRFHWEHDDDPGSFFELRIRIDPMTNETCLMVTDHAWPNDLTEAKALWESQIHTLQRVLGA